MQEDSKPTADQEAVPFDDCLRLLVNTPPKPKKGKPPPDEGEEEESEN